MRVVEVSTVEMQVAKEVVAPLAECGRMECVTAEDGTIRCRLRGAPEWKLCSVVFSSEGLRRLAGDPDRAVKIEYLQRDIARTARFRSEYRYPHHSAAYER